MVAMAAFSVGVYLGTRIVKPRGRGGSGVWPRRVTVTLGLSLLGHAGFLILWLAVGGQIATIIGSRFTGGVFVADEAIRWICLRNEIAKRAVLKKLQVQIGRRTIGGRGTQGTLFAACIRAAQ